MLIKLREYFSLDQYSDYKHMKSETKTKIIITNLKLKTNDFMDLTLTNQ